MAECKWLQSLFQVCCCPDVALAVDQLRSTMSVSMSRHTPTNFTCEGECCHVFADLVLSVSDVNLERTGSIQQQTYTQSFSLPGFMPYRGEFDVVSGECCSEWGVVQ